MPDAALPSPAPLTPGRAGLRVAVIGGGPAGLMAAEVLAAGGAQVDLFDALPSVGRKFLLAGKGGLNLTHSEPLEPFLGRYAAARPALEPIVRQFDADALRAWAQQLGVATFVGSSGRVFPADMKAAPLLRAWLHRLRAAGVAVHTRHRWLGWAPGADGAGALRFATPAGEQVHRPQATVLALGGASWSRLGSDGAWVPWLAAREVAITPLQPANCGFDLAPAADGRIGWSEFMRSRYAGQPVKPVAASVTDAAGHSHRQQGEFVLTDTGVEGSLVYAFSARLREAIAAQGSATLLLDLLPNHSADQVLAEVQRPRGPRSLATHLKSRLGIAGLKLALLHERLGADGLADAPRLAAALKALPLVLGAPRPIDEAISTAGGVAWGALDSRLMLRALPGVFCAGEMLDWEAPTGGYLLTACLATGRAAGQGVLAWAAQPSNDASAAGA
ncbi:TIGR03862 family flavoprotein [Aquabacterium sp. OR-4]|uniref:TIGR03862 family flavoprotein n=1 Tax=Aquabacterium sp. OR-4 TaxID=2978127 RepID=UPI0021B3039F|nr:TIGR03862 family flavoprotein [Aquabacterium sp. OR-4]MDT7837112.1 TIGR03862 family flavoprotein [Aquabacterium sp. OR-4]